MKKKRDRLAVATAFVFSTLFFAGASVILSEDAPNEVLKKTRVVVGGVEVLAEVAETATESRRGLMFRTSLEKNEGMLFPLRKGKACFWMKNTGIPLSAAFVDEKGRIESVVDMLPFSEESNCSKGEVIAVLEMNKGWFAERGLSVGSKVEWYLKGEVK